MSFFHRMGVIKWDEAAHPRGPDGKFAPSGESPTAAGEKEYADAVAGKRDAWVPGGGGKELPSVDKMGRRTLRVFNPGTGKHGNYDMDTDIVEEDRTGNYDDYLDQMEALAQHRAYRKAYRQSGGDSKAGRRAMLEAAEQHGNRPMPQAGDKALMNDDRTGDSMTAERILLHAAVQRTKTARTASLDPNNGPKYYAAAKARAAYDNANWDRMKALGIPSLRDPKK